MNAAPRVSVLLPARDAGPTLAASLRSVQRQTEARFECVVVDDGSNDGSADLVRAFAARDARFRLVSRPRAGLVAALEAGLAECRGAVVARMDADDVMARDRLALAVNFDMVSRSDRREIFVAGPGRWPLLTPLLTPLATDAPVTVRFGHDTGGGTSDWTMQSDHGAFHQAGIPFVYFGVEDHADYHQPTDTADKIRPDFLAGVATVAMRALQALDRAAAFR